MNEWILLRTHRNYATFKVMFALLFQRNKTRHQHQFCCYYFLFILNDCFCPWGAFIILICFFCHKNNSHNLDINGCFLPWTFLLLWLANNLNSLKNFYCFLLKKPPRLNILTIPFSFELPPLHLRLQHCPESEHSAVSRTHAMISLKSDLCNHTNENTVKTWWK